jgi:hypothetical protein
VPAESPPGSFHSAGFGQARIVAALTARLDELMPEPIDAVLERQDAQRAQVAEQLRGIAQ